MDALALYGTLLGPQWWLYSLGFGVLTLAFGYLGAPLILWTLAGAVALWGFGAPMVVLAAYAGVALVMNTPIRRFLLSAPILNLMKKLNLIPAISDTERTALEAGAVWVEGDLFSGSPNFKKMLKEPIPQLTEEEKAYLDGPVEDLCEMINDF